MKKKSTTLTIVILVETICLMATAIGFHHLETVLKECTMTALVGMVNLVLGFFIGRTPKKKKRKARPSPTPQRRAPLFYFFTNSAFSYLSSSPNFICTRQLFFKLAFTSIFLWLVDPLNFRSIILFCS